MSDILIIDDEKEILTRLTSFIQGMGYIVDSCERVDAALELMNQTTYKLIVSDINLPDASGLEILKWSKKNSPDTKIILITAFLDECDVKDALELECFGFIAKPINKEEITRIITNAIDDGDNTKITDDSFARIDINDFLCGKVLNFPVYLRLKENRFLKVAHTGTEICLKRIQSLRKQGVKELWIDQSDLNGYIELNDKILNSKHKWTPQAKAKVLNHFTELTFENMRLFNISEENVTTCAESIKDIVKNMFRTQNSHQIINNLSFNAGKLSKNAILSLSFGILAAKVLGWISARNIYSLAIGAFFRDIALLEINCESEDFIFDQAFKKSPAFLDHPARGAKIIQSHFPEDISTAQIVLEHHEDGTPYGFPSQLSLKKIFPLAYFTNMIDYYLELLACEKDYTQLPNTIEQAMIKKYGRDERSYALILLLRSKSIEDAKKDLLRLKNRQVIQ